MSARDSTRAATHVTMIRSGLKILSYLVLLLGLVANVAVAVEEVGRDKVARLLQEEVETSTPTESPSDAPSTAPSRAPSTAPSGAPSTSSPSSSPITKHRKYPSLLVMMADDLGYGDVGYTGGWAKTPNIDALSQSYGSLRLDNFHSASAVCSPTRASMISGRNPERDCVLQAFENNVGHSFRNGMPSIARYARMAGIKTALYGKWHLGSKTPEEVGFEDFAYTHQNTPNFDPSCFCSERRCLTSCSAPDQCFNINKRRCGSRLTSECQMAHYKRTGKPSLNPMNWFCDLEKGGMGKPIETAAFPRGVAASEHVANLTTSFLHSLDPMDSFLVYAFFHEPHEPFVASDYERARCFNGESCLEQVRKHGFNSGVVSYYSVIHVMDRAIGQIIAALDETGRRHDTILIFTSDNGPAGPDIGGIPMVATHKVLRGVKRQVYEGGIRVPTVIRWPQHISTNTIIPQTTSMFDIIATYADAIQSISPELGTLLGDGESLMGLFSEPSTWVRTKPFVTCMPVQKNLQKVCVTYAYFWDNYKIVIKNNKRGKAEFYNVVDNPRETSNLAKRFPNKAAALNAAVAAKQSVLLEFRKNCPVLAKNKNLRKG